ncbi:MAG: rRNA pseudouridine synthase [Chloroflexi bacterium]|nr:rRNA pseudouridine synthase [Chloroflexota bacterium]
MAREKRRSRVILPCCISRVAGRQQVAILLAAAGVGSHNRCQRLIAEGRVAVNGQPVRQAGERADPLQDVLTVDGAPVRMENFCLYLAFHKPYQVLPTFTDKEGRATLADYVPLPGVYAAGRLDYDSEGLMILTNDGWLNHRLTHPRFEHPKTYLVQVERIPSPEAIEALRRGVEIKGKRTRPAQVELLLDDEVPDVSPRSVPIRYRKHVPTAWLRIVLYEGRKRQIRHMTAAVGHPTLRLIRTAIGPIELGELSPGSWRHLTEEELRRLASSWQPLHK